jgi:hypothetical protein
VENRKRWVFHLPLATRCCPNLALSLFVFGVLTDDPDHPFSFYNFTLITDLFNRSPNLHCLYPVVEEIEFTFSNPPSGRRHSLALENSDPFAKGDEGNYLFLPENNSASGQVIG